MIERFATTFARRGGRYSPLLGGSGPTAASNGTAEQREMKTSALTVAAVGLVNRW